MEGLKLTRRFIVEIVEPVTSKKAWFDQGYLHRRRRDIFELAQQRVISEAILAGWMGLPTQKLTPEDLQYFLVEQAVEIGWGVKDNYYCDDICREQFSLEYLREMLQRKPDVPIIHTIR